MDHRDPTTLETATPEYVLAVIRDLRRQGCCLDLGDAPTAVLGRETTVSEWLGSFAVFFWRGPADALDEEFELNASIAQWKRLLVPTRSRTLGEVCDWIAPRATRRRIRPAGFLGGSCLSAGAFLAVRSLLAEAGADVGAIAPSTPLAAFARRHSDVFLGPISRLAPEAIPTVRVDVPRIGVKSFVRFALGVIGLLAACVVDSPLLIWARSLGFACWVVRGIRRYQSRISVAFGDLVNFRDLAEALAVGAAADTSRKNFHAV